MKRYFTSDFEKRFAIWWQKGYYGDLDTYNINMGNYRIYMPNPNPLNYYYLFAQVAKHESEVKGRYKPIEEYIKQGWEIYARRGDEGFYEWWDTLPNGIFAKIRRWLIDNGKIYDINPQTNLHSTFARLVKNHTGDFSKLKAGDHLHKERLLPFVGMSGINREIFRDYPDLQSSHDEIQKERESRKSR